jgi:cytochrome P450
VNTLTDAELFSDAFLADPYPFYRGWREQSPVWWSERLGGYVVSRYADVRRGFGDGKAFRQSQKFERGLTEALGARPLVAMDPPAHTLVRSAFSGPFRPHALEELMGSAVTEAVTTTIATLADGAAFELGREVSTPVAMAVVARLIGSDDSPQLGGLYSAVLDSLRRVRMNQAEGEELVGRAAGADLIAYLRDLRSRSVRTSGLDLVTTIATAQGLDERQIVTTCANLLVAGVETTVGGVATTIYALLTHEPELGRVRSDPNLARRCFDEALRWVSPVQIIGKQVAQSVKLDATQLQPGDEVFLLVGSANRDPERYDEPHRYRLDRLNRDHLAFGSGLHLCVGAPLSRLEARLIVNQLLARFPRLDVLEPNASLDWSGGPSARAPAELWLTGSV